MRDKYVPGVKSRNHNFRPDVAMIWPSLACFQWSKSIENYWRYGFQELGCAAFVDFGTTHMRKSPRFWFIVQSIRVVVFHECASILYGGVTDDKQTLVRGMQKKKNRLFGLRLSSKAD